MHRGNLNSQLLHHRPCQQIEFFWDFPTSLYSYKSMSTYSQYFTAVLNVKLAHRLSMKHGHTPFFFVFFYFLFFQREGTIYYSGEKQLYIHNIGWRMKTRTSCIQSSNIEQYVFKIGKISSTCAMKDGVCSYIFLLHKNVQRFE